MSRHKNVCTPAAPCNRQGRVPPPKRQILGSVRDILLGVVVVAAFLTACRGKKATDTPNDNNGPPVTVDATEFTYALEEGSEAFPLWTAPATKRLRTNERPPETVRSGLFAYAAKGEFEPIQLILGPVEGEATVQVEAFQSLGSGARVEVMVAGYESGVAETLTPVTADTEISLNGAYGVPIWVRLFIPPDAPAGEHVTTVNVTRRGETIAVPLTVYVFDFEIPREIHFATQLNVSIESLLGEGSVDDAKTLLFEHRMTPKSVTWPSGFNWGITWENSASSAPCETLWDEPTEGEAYSIGHLARRYILGDGWNGVGFPNAMLFQFVDNNTPRPESFCGEGRGDHFGSDGYNGEWSAFLTAIEGYLDDNGLLEKAYYYIQNEPQDDDDHRLAAHLCRLTKAAAPGLRIAISEEPKPEIAEDEGGACGYDIWIAHVRAYQQSYAWERQRLHGEEVWLYSLDQDPDPYFNPTRVDAEGMHLRIIPWVAWTLRARGWAYYDAGRFFNGNLPTIRAELLREGFEDYEYLYLAAGGAHPEVDQEIPVDDTVYSVASGLTSWTRDPDALMALRRELGFYLEGKRDTLPVLEVDDAGGRRRDAYYINFQDPAGQPTDEPLVVDGNTYMKMGWMSYDEDVGYGWYGEYVEDDGIALFGYDDVTGYSEAAKSYVYDDYGRDNLFEFALENGIYDVTVGAGRPARGYSDPHNVTVEGVPAIVEQPTSDDEPTIEATVRITLTDGRLSVETGGLSETTGEWSYTFFSYLIIEPV